jgi:hypothetical protein
MCAEPEIDARTQFTGFLPRDSHLRPWFEDILPHVRTDIRNGFPGTLISDL